MVRHDQLPVDREPHDDDSFQLESAGQARVSGNFEASVVGMRYEF
jgi:hypothetical protein